MIILSFYLPFLVSCIMSFQKGVKKNTHTQKQNKKQKVILKITYWNKLKQIWLSKSLHVDAGELVYTCSTNKEVHKEKTVVPGDNHKRVTGPDKTCNIHYTGTYIIYHYKHKPKSSPINFRCKIITCTNLKHFTRIILCSSAWIRSPSTSPNWFIFHDQHLL